MHRICVFCGSSMGHNPLYTDAAKAMGTGIATRGYDLVYGGGQVGLMGIVADAALSANGKVIGVIPKALDDLEVGHKGLTELHIVSSMHIRKAMMADLSDGFVALPGGYGTFDELCEILTWAQLGQHVKPIGLLNVKGYFDPFLAMLDKSVEEGFLKAVHRQLLHVDAEIDPLLKKLEQAEGKPLGLDSKWIGPTER